MTGMVGSVTRQRYDELVRLGRDWVETMSSVQWQLGDAAMEIEPMRSYGGTNPSGSEKLFTVSEAIRMFAEDVGLAYPTVRDYRWVASRWPKEHRRAGVSHTIHKSSPPSPDVQERFEAVNNPSPSPRGGPARWTHDSANWTHDSAKRIVGWKVDTPESVQEKVDAIHDLAADVQDRDAARILLTRLHAEHPEIVLVWADNGYGGEEFSTWAQDAQSPLSRILQDADPMTAIFLDQEPLQANGPRRSRREKGGGAWTCPRRVLGVLPALSLAFGGFLRRSAPRLFDAAGEGQHPGGCCQSLVTEGVPSIHQRSLAAAYRSNSTARCR